MTGQMAMGDTIPAWCVRVVTGVPHGGGKKPSRIKSKGSTPRSEHGQNAGSISASITGYQHITNFKHFVFAIIFHLNDPSILKYIKQIMKSFL
jgi:hypothetical protein